MLGTKLLGGTTTTITKLTRVGTCYEACNYRNLSKVTSTIVSCCTIHYINMPQLVSDRMKIAEQD